MAKMSRGFSLVELSIVLVILGLLTGGILTGQNLIRAAELRSVTTEFQAFQTAAMTFRDKYFALPGDMLNAEDFWGSPGGNPANCPATAGTGTETCNGNGDGIMTAGSAAEYGEWFTFWQHLANAGLIEGNYTGIAGTSAGDTIARVNAPTGKMSTSHWFIRNRGTMSGSGSMFDNVYNNMLQLGGDRSGDEPADNFLIPEDMWNIDTKIDDGMPATGLVVVRSRLDCTTLSDGSTITNSAAHAAESDAIYNLSSTTIACSIIFRDVF